MFPTAQLGCKCIKPLPGSNNTQTFHIRTIWTDCTPPTIITCREADSYSVLKSKLNIWGLQFPVWLKHFGLDVSGYPQTALTKQRESLEEPLKVFTLPSHQHSGFWIPGDGEETINTPRIHRIFEIGWLFCSQFLDLDNGLRPSNSSWRQLKEKKCMEILFAMSEWFVTNNICNTQNIVFEICTIRYVKMCS